MSFSYYHLPLRVDLLIKKEALPLCDLRQSIAHHLHLLLTTAFGELQSNEQFGTSIWEADFENVNSKGTQKETILQTINAAIAGFEKRIHQVRVDLSVHQEEMRPLRDERKMKRRMDVKVTAVVKATNEPIVYNDSFFISPLSYN